MQLVVWLHLDISETLCYVLCEAADIDIVHRE